MQAPQSPGRVESPQQSEMLKTAVQHRNPRPRKRGLKKSLKEKLNTMSREELLEKRERLREKLSALHSYTDRTQQIQQDLKNPDKRLQETAWQQHQDIKKLRKGLHEAHQLETRLSRTHLSDNPGTGKMMIDPAADPGVQPERTVAPVLASAVGTQTPRLERRMSL